MRPGRCRKVAEEGVGVSLSMTNNTMRCDYEKTQNIDETSRRRRGAPKGNQRALKHGCRSAATRRRWADVAVLIARTKRLIVLAEALAEEKNANVYEIAAILNRHFCSGSSPH